MAPDDRTLIPVRDGAAVVGCSLAHFERIAQELGLLHKMGKGPGNGTKVAAADVEKVRMEILRRAKPP